jgi:Dyp-type peroxidase family
LTQLSQETNPHVLALSKPPVREAPAPDPIHGGLNDPAHPDASKEPVLDMDNIQGNILGGFNKDNQLLLFFKLTDVQAFRTWLTDFVPYISTSAEVVAFNRLFKFIRRRQGEEDDRPFPVKATWRNIAFTYEAILEFKKHIPNLLKDRDGTDRDFVDQAFKAGMAKRAAGLGDKGKEGDPAHWLVGGATKTDVDHPHVLIHVASDDAVDLDQEVTWIKKNIQGAKWVFEQPGKNLPKNVNGKDLAGHEHFGFLDGISQPGIRGRISNDPHDVLTPRQNANNRDHGKPGQDLLWPGEFVFGYAGQDAEQDITQAGALSSAGPEWARNGSFLVYRRLRQNVFGFHTFLNETARTQGVPTPKNASGAEAVGANLVGRWQSGAPVLRTPDDEIQALGGDDCANNNFEFAAATPPLPPAGTENRFDCIDDVFPTSPGDPAGMRCPFTGHIRKAYPRNDEAVNKNLDSTKPECSDARQILNERDTQTHRLLRRGIPFGTASTSTPAVPHQDEPADGKGRGLVFLAFQTSVERQFEFVTKCWVNNPDFKEPFGTAADDPIKRGGHDPIIGQSPNGKREFTLTFPNPASANKIKSVRLTTEVDWVIPTGGGYFFAPSMKALRLIFAK